MKNRGASYFHYRLLEHWETLRLARKNEQMSQELLDLTYENNHLRNQLLLKDYENSKIFKQDISYIKYLKNKMKNVHFYGKQYEKYNGSPKTMYRDFSGSNSLRFGRTTDRMNKSLFQADRKQKYQEKTADKDQPSRRAKIDRSPYLKTKYNTETKYNTDNHDNLAQGSLKKDKFELQNNKIDHNIRSPGDKLKIIKNIRNQQSMTPARKNKKGISLTKLNKSENNESN